MGPCPLDSTRGLDPQAQDQPLGLRQVLGPGGPDCTRDLWALVLDSAGTPNDPQPVDQPWS